VWSTVFLPVLSYLSTLTFVGVSIVKVVKYATMPTHLRWELYPVAHEKGRSWGGSYLEELDWWTKPRRKSLVGELKYMVREASLFSQCYHRNRGLWYFTYPLHIGLFLLVIWLLLLLIGASTMLTGVSVSISANVWGKLIYYLTLAVGSAGLVAGTIGCIGLLVRRSVEKNLKLYTTPVDYFNLSLILAILISGIYSWLLFDPTFSTAREYVKNLLTFTLVTTVNPAMSAGIVLFSLFLIYMPFTQMMHGLAKYFTYHRVRWDDEPNLMDSDMEKRVRRLLNQPVSWSAPPIQDDRRFIVRPTGQKYCAGLKRDT